MKVLRCLRCKGIFADIDMSNPGHCPFCDSDCDSMLEGKSSDQEWHQEDLRQLWRLFGDIPINDEDEILEPFMDWPEGTIRFDIWSWFDKKYKGGVYKLCEETE